MRHSGRAARRHVARSVITVLTALQVSGRKRLASRQIAKLKTVGTG